MNERTHYFHADDLGRLELLHARYITHRFDRHVHSGYAIGVILAGAERFYYRGVQRHLAPAGSVVVVEPDEIHTGEAAVAAGWQYRMFYPQVELIQEIATELGGKSRGTPHFPEAVIHDQQVAGLLVQLHHTLDRSEDRLTRGSLARQAFGALLRRHARHPVTPQRLGAERAVVQRVRQYLLADLADNLSLDTLDKERFHQITRRDSFDKVMDCFHQLVGSGIQTKINTVVMDGQNTEDIIPLAELTRQYPVSVRFIEEMPFNGEGSHYPVLVWTHKKIVDKLRSQYPELQKIPDGPHSTSYNYQIPGHQGTVGIIAAFSRTFCGSCNRIRMTAQGTLKTCLYDDGVLDIKKIMREGASNEELKAAFLSAFRSRAKDGYEAEQRRDTGKAVSESMSTIGG